MQKKRKKKKKRKNSHICMTKYLICLDFSLKKSLYFITRICFVCRINPNQRSNWCINLIYSQKSAETLSSFIHDVPESYMNTFSVRIHFPFRSKLNSINVGQLESVFSFSLFLSFSLTFIPSGLLVSAAAAPTL